MNAHLHLARRGSDPRPECIAPGHAPGLGSAPVERIIPRLSPSGDEGSREGTRRDRTPSPVPPSPRRIDPRWYQIAMLSALLGFGVLGLGFGLSVPRIVATIGAALATQYLCGRLWRLPKFDPLSALISGIGLCTLLRTGSVGMMAFAAALAIASKFVLRFGGKHLYNPTNLALVVMLIAGWGWISPGQYGHVAFVALLMVCLGLTVVCKAGRSDVTLAFLAIYAAILFGRSLWMGEPLRIPVHRLQSGLLLQFAFNMISDPRTTPDSRAGRLLFGALVAIGAGIVQFVLFRTNGPVWSLAACTLLVPLLDRVLKGPRHEWKPVQARAGTTMKGAFHENLVPAPALAGGVHAARGTLARHRP